MSTSAKQCEAIGVYLQKMSVFWPGPRLLLSKADIFCRYNSYGLTLLSTCAQGLQFYCPSCNFIQKLSNFFARYASSEFIHDFDSFLYYVFSIYIYILAISLLPRAMILPFILDKDVETSTRYFNFKSVSIIYKAKKYQSNSLHNYNYTEMHRFIYLSN